jgi:hypothetical protein
MLRNIKRGFQPRITVCRDETGDRVASERQILNRGPEYFEKHLNSNAMQPLIVKIVFFRPGIARTCTHCHRSVRCHWKTGKQ